MKSNLHCHLVVLCLLIFSVGILGQERPARSAGAEVTFPRLIRINGSLTDGHGQPRSGIVGITLSLYSAQEGGEPLWRESQTVQTDGQGRYSVYLGATEKEGLPLELFSSDQARWLGVQVQGEEEQPRTMFVSVPYALKAKDADTVGGRPLSSFV